MQVSLQWLREFVEIQESPDVLADVLTNLGLEVEEWHHFGEEYEGFLIGTIRDITPHPEKPNLQVCRIDLGDRQITIVSGAPNLSAGSKVVVALPGTTLPGTGETIESRSFGEIVSEGMICSRYELGLGDSDEDRSTIWTLPDDAPVGSTLRTYLQWEDTVLSVALTPNRADCLSHIGIAREIAAYYQRPLQQPSVVVNEQPPSTKEAIRIEIQDPELCPRYAGRLIRNVTIGPSPLWLQQRLLAVGLRPRNVVVDVTNYVLMELGHPLHAFDYDKLAGPAIIVRPAEQEESFVTLDGKTRLLQPGMLLICDAEKPVAIAGVMGGANSEITEQTTNVFLESAYFHPSSIRRTAKQLGLSTEASYRFERGTDIENVPRALDRAAALIATLTGGTVASDIYDVYPSPPIPKQIRLRYQRVRRILGAAIDPDTIDQILQRLSFTPLHKDPEGIVVGVPSFRVDIDEEIDLIEEIARLWGYDAIEPQTTSKLLYTAPKLPPSLLPLPDKLPLAQHLIHSGFTETVNPHMIDPSTASRFTDAVVRIANPLGEELSALRPSLIPSIIRVIDRNIRVQQTDLRIFEIGKIFLKVNSEQSFIPGYTEKEHLIFALTGYHYPKHWGVKRRPYDFFDAKGMLEHLIKLLHLADVQLRPFVDLPFYYTGNALQAVWNDEEIGSVGELHPDLLRRTEIQQPVFIGLLYLDKIASIPRRQPRYTPVSAFPTVERDLAFIVDAVIPAGDIEAVIRQSAGPFLKHLTIFDVFTNPKVLGEGKKSIAFALQFNAPDHTLTDEEVQQFIDQIIAAVQEKFNAQLRA